MCTSFVQHGVGLTDSVLNQLIDDTQDGVPILLSDCDLSEHYPIERVSTNFRWRCRNLSVKVCKNLSSEAPGCRFRRSHGHAEFCSGKSSRTLAPLKLG